MDGVDSDYSLVKFHESELLKLHLSKFEAFFRTISLIFSMALLALLHESA